MEETRSHPVCVICGRPMLSNLNACDECNADLTLTDMENALDKLEKTVEIIAGAVDDYEFIAE